MIYLFRFIFSRKKFNKKEKKIKLKNIEEKFEKTFGFES